MENGYLDFEIHIDQSDTGDYPLAVRSPAGEARTHFSLPFESAQLQMYLANLGSFHSTHEREFGQTLFAALLTGDVRSLYYESQREAEHSAQGLRIKLTIVPPELAVLPWEYLYDPREAEFVCLSRNTPIVRYLELAQPIRTFTVTPPLRILGVAVSPLDLPQLDLVREKLRVEQALDALQNQVKLTWLAGQSWQALLQAMRQGPWHILHFIGHGGFESTLNQGVIMLADEQGNAHPLPATHLGRILADHASLRLVLLNACEGATGNQLDIFSSTAATLLRRGIPAIVAMQYAISDQAAIEFSQAFYSALADGSPVDAAISDARKAISLALPDSAEWGTPVLHMRAPNGHILAIDRTDEGEAHSQTQSDTKTNRKRVLADIEKEKMVNIDVKQLAEGVLTLLTPYLVIAGGALAQKTGDAVAEKALQLFNRIKERFAKDKDSYARQALDRFEQEPDKRKAGFQEVLEEILTQDSEFAQSLTTLLAESGAASAGPTFNTQVYGGQVDTITNIQSVTGGITFNKGAK